MLKLNSFSLRNSVSMTRLQKIYVKSAESLIHCALCKNVQSLYIGVSQIFLVIEKASFPCITACLPACCLHLSHYSGHQVSLASTAHWANTKICWSRVDNFVTSLIIFVHPIFAGLFPLQFCVHSFADSSNVSISNGKARTYAA